MTGSLARRPPANPGGVTLPAGALARIALRRRLGSLPHGFIDRLFGIGPGGWLLYQAPVEQDETGRLATVRRVGRR